MFVLLDVFAEQCHCRMLQSVSQFHVVSCLCVYICVYLCVYLCMCVWVCVYLCVCVCLLVCLFLSFLLVCVYVSVCVCVFVCVVCLCVCVCLCVPVGVCMRKLFVIVVLRFQRNFQRVTLLAIPLPSSEMSLLVTCVPSLVYTMDDSHWTVEDTGGQCV